MLLAFLEVLQQKFLIGAAHRQNRKSNSNNTDQSPIRKNNPLSSLLRTKFQVFPLDIGGVAGLPNFEQTALEFEALRFLGVPLEDIVAVVLEFE